MCSQRGRQPANIRLYQRDEVADDDRQSGERGEYRRPAGNHCMPCSAAVHRSESDEHDFSKHDERRHFRARRDESSARNGRALVGIRRPKMERRGGDFESKSNQGHEDSDEE